MPELQRFFVFGLGISGAGVARFLLRQGHFVVVADDNSSARERFLSSLDEEEAGRVFVATDYAQYDFSKNGVSELIISPGVPIKFPRPHVIVESATRSRVRITSDVEIFSRYFPSIRIFAITGTNGKSTTTALIGAILQKANLKAVVSGNIGFSPFEKVGSGTTDVSLEVSSFQLETSVMDCSCAVLLGITPDHLERTAGMNGYIHAKKSVLLNSSGCRVIDVGNRIGVDLYNEIDSLDLPGRTVPVCYMDNEGSLGDGARVALGRGYCINGKRNIMRRGEFVANIPDHILLVGRHNLCNILAAFVACFEMGVEKDVALDSVCQFKPLRHRLELVRKLQFIEFYNDSKATNLASTLVALEAFGGDCDIYLVAGGRMVNEDLSDLMRALSAEVSNRVRHIALIGECGGHFAKNLQDFNACIDPKSQNVDSGHTNKNKMSYTICGDLGRAVSLLCQIARRDLGGGDSPKGGRRAIILLSPMSKSFDQFANFESRGDAFAVLCSKIS